MSRNRILAAGALLWALTAADAVGHALMGDWLVPGGMAIILVSWIVLRRPAWRLVEAS
ncbi:MAG TPA: hypothetical protein VHS36_01625 [Candidatus Limnocylindrales bacterium]|jgi:hypothetical protein|nr:hypothetical protein [Candidatus Limnocylindrales bacterium]